MQAISTRHKKGLRCSDQCAEANSSFLTKKHSLSCKKEARASSLFLGDDGYPYTVPLNYLYVEADEPEALGKVYFHSAKAGHKIDAIERDPKASFCVIADDTVLPDKYSTAYKSIIAFGTVRLIEGNLAHKALFDLGDKYNPHHEDRTLEEVNSAEHKCAMIEFTIEHLTGKESHSYRKQREQTE
ncbi:MAG: pyridoxamine 5'-phosphate oxidase family protein [Eggerthellaceae bacterium]